MREIWSQSHMVSDRLEDYSTVPRELCCKGLPIHSSHRRRLSTASGLSDCNRQDERSHNVPWIHHQERWTGETTGDPMPTSPRYRIQIKRNSTSICWEGWKRNIPTWGYSPLGSRALNQNFPMPSWIQHQRGLVFRPCCPYSRK